MCARLPTATAAGSPQLQIAEVIVILYALLLGALQATSNA